MERQAFNSSGLKGLTLEDFRHHRMSKLHQDIKTEWPKHHLVSRKPIDGSLSYTGIKQIAPLRFDGWEVIQNPEFTRIHLQIISGGSLCDKWIDVLSALGQPYDVLAKTPRFTVRLPRPVCTAAPRSRMIILHMNQVSDLEYPPEG